MSEVLTMCAVAIAILMAATWLLSLVLKDVSIVDPVWAFGFVIVAWTAYVTGQAPTNRGWLIVMLVTVWGLRLGAHLTWRWFRESGEDRRYQALRRKYPPFSLTSFFIVFALQGALMWIVSLPVLLALADPSAVRHPLPVIVGGALWTIGVFFEAVGDFQLTRFRRDSANAGKVMDRGLWVLTRHPNYFGDFMVWLGLLIVCLEAPNAWPGVIGTLTMSALLMKGSGVAVLEKTIESRRPGYTQYARRTNTFFPGPPKRKTKR